MGCSLDLRELEVMWVIGTNHERACNFSKKAKECVCVQWQWCAKVLRCCLSALRDKREDMQICWEENKVSQGLLGKMRFCLIPRGTKYLVRSF